MPRMTIGRKIGGGFTLVVAVYACAVGMTYTVNVSARHHIADATTHLYPLLTKAQEMKVAVVQVQQRCTDISATRGRDGLNDGLDEAADWARRFRSANEDALGLAPEDRDRLRSMRDACEPYYTTGIEMANAYIAGGPDGGNPMMGDFDAVAETINEQVDAYLAEYQGRFEEGMAATSDDPASINLVILLTLFASVAASIAIAWPLTRRIVRPTRAAVTLAEQIAAGRLDGEEVVVGTGDEIGALSRALNDMRGSLHGTIARVAENAGLLAAASTEVASSAEQMARNSLAQTDQTAQVSAGIEQMTVTIVESSKRAGDTAELARAAADTAQTGEDVVRTTIEGMGRIADSTQDTMSVISGLAGNVQQIGEITAVIDDIADQTNLLALNAAIEAARAGEQGRGFAVVADEVRKLAERTTKATTEITDMIKAVADRSNDAVEAMTAAGLLVDEGRDKADKAGDALREILDVSRKVQDMIGQIATATDEQSAAAGQISQNVESINTVTRENSMGAEEAARAAEDLSRRTEGLEQLVGQFTLG